MDFSLSDEERAVRDTARQFITREVMPLEQEALLRERRHQPGLERSELRELQLKAKKFGFWGLSTPEEFGGMHLPAVLQSLIWTEVGRTFVQFKFGGEADNTRYCGNAEQKKEYLRPASGVGGGSCSALPEPGAAPDPANIKPGARRDGDDWVLNGEKAFSPNGNDADFVIVVAVTDPE